MNLDNINVLLESQISMSRKLMNWEATFIGQIPVPVSSPKFRSKRCKGLSGNPRASRLSCLIRTDVRQHFARLRACYAFYHRKIYTNTPYGTFLPLKTLQRSTSPLQKGHTLVTPTMRARDVLAPHQEELPFDTTFSAWNSFLQVHWSNQVRPSCS